MSDTSGFAAPDPSGQPYPSYGQQSYDKQASYPQQTYGPPPVPPTNAGWAVAAVLFFWPLAFSAFNHSSSVFPRWSTGDYQGAQYASDRAKQLGKWALLIWVILIAVLIVFYILLIVFVVAAGTSYSTY